jgi:hypothetical protein
MVKQIKLTHDADFYCEYIVNGEMVEKFAHGSEHIFTVSNLPCHVNINIKPYKITPKIRIDNILVNYGLAKITPWDHMLEFTLDHDFFDKYFKNIIDSKIKYLNVSEEQGLKKLGYEDLSDLVSKIETNIR